MVFEVLLETFMGEFQLCLSTWYKRSKVHRLYQQIPTFDWSSWALLNLVKAGNIKKNTKKKTVPDLPVPLYIWNLWLPVANISGNDRLNPWFQMFFRKLEDEGVMGAMALPRQLSTSLGLPRNAQPPPHRDCLCLSPHWGRLPNLSRSPFVTP